MANKKNDTLESKLEVVVKLFRAEVVQIHIEVLATLDERLLELKNSNKNCCASNQRKAIKMIYKINMVRLMQPTSTSINQRSLL